jgi:hypothetical protein
MYCHGDLMQIAIETDEFEFQAACSSFDGKIAPILLGHLQNECILDRAGIERVMPLLKKSYLHGMRTLKIGFTFNDHERGPLSEQGEVSPLRIDELKTMSETIGRHISETVSEAQLEMLFSMARTLAAYDEKTFKRPRH